MTDLPQPTRVVHIHTGNEVAPATPNRIEVIELLETALMEARAGEISGCALATTKPDGAISNRWSGDDVVNMVASITMLQHEFLTAVLAARP